MSENERYEIARAYVDRQLRTMKKNGLRIKKISGHKYRALVRQVAQAVSASEDSNRPAISSTSQT